MTLAQEEVDSTEELEELLPEDRIRRLSMTPQQRHKLKVHKELTDKIHNLYETKNMDYGDSMHPLFEEYGLTAFLVMFEIKLNRIKSLNNKKGERHYESLEDSLMDLANYALIALTELQNKEEENNE